MIEQGSSRCGLYLTVEVTEFAPAETTSFKAGRKQAFLLL